MPVSSVEIDTSRLDRILRNLDGNISKAVREIAFNVEGKAKANAPVDTGALRSSIYTATQNDNRMPSAGAGDVVRVPLPTPTDDHTAHVGPSVDYGIYVELGTHRMPGRPYLGNAVDVTTNELAARFGEAVTDG